MHCSLVFGVCVCVWHAVNIITSQAAELATWKAKVAMMTELGETQLPNGKHGNGITRAWKKTGWCPLLKDSENWQKVLATIGQREEAVDGERPIKCRTGR